MAQTRLDPDKNSIRVHAISEYKQARERIKTISSIATTPSGEALRDMLRKIAQSAASRINTVLDSEDGSDANYKAAVSARAEMRAYNFVLATIEKPGEAEEYINNQIAEMEAHIKAADAGELV